MRRFSQLFDELDRTTRTSEKLRALERYFSQAEPVDASWALYFLTGHKIKRAVNTRLLREWVSEETQVPLWLVEESYDAVGDLAETLALLIPRRDSTRDWSLAQLISERIVPLANADPREQRRLIAKSWSELGAKERLVWHKLILGEFRVGVARTLVARALANVAGVSSDIMAHRLMGHWRPTAEDYAALLGEVEPVENPARPYPFYLATQLDIPLAELGDIGDWQFEWKWDGIRGQLIQRQGDVLLWSRGEELVTDRYPEVAAVGAELPAGTVLDGELLAWRDGAPLPFSALQRRIGLKRVSAGVLKTAPVTFVAYDVMELDATDIRGLSLVERRLKLEKLVQTLGPIRGLTLSPLVAASSWAELERLQASARDRGVEGLMLKRRDSVYGVGRPRGDWWKWKSPPLSVDAVLIYAQRGHGRRASLYSDYTFAVWHEGALVPIAKAYSGLTDAEMHEVDLFVRSHTTSRFGPVRVVDPQLVFELHFEGVQVSTRHKAGLAVRFPRIGRWRRDKSPADADSLATLHGLAGNHHSG